jgi:hypothetical protein
MTVISAVITQHHTAHASDSFLTTLKTDGSREIIEDQQSKLLYVKHWRGAIAFWGLARCGQWSTLDWLQGQGQKAANFPSAEGFADAIAAGLNQELAMLPLSKASDKGIGMHFTAYERISDYWIPELFLISNWTGIPYTDIRQGGVGVSRATYHILKEKDGVVPAPQHREPKFRIEVHQALVSGTMFRYNNGDPELFNPPANAILDTFFKLMQRGVLSDPNTEKTHCALVRRPIEVIARLLTDFSKEGKRLIGGKLHDICISPDGTCWSSTGDCV